MAAEIISITKVYQAYRRPTPFKFLATLEQRRRDYQKFIKRYHSVFELAKENAKELDDEESIHLLPAVQLIGEYCDDNSIVYEDRLERALDEISSVNSDKWYWKDFLDMYAFMLDIVKKYNNEKEEDEKPVKLTPNVKPSKVKTSKKSKRVEAATQTDDTYTQNLTERIDNLMEELGSIKKEIAMKA